MLGKLIKHEFGSTARFLLPFYAGILVLAAVGRLFIAISTSDAFIGDATTFSTILNIFTKIIEIIFDILTSLSFLITLFYLIMRFNSNFFKDEGYLTFSLPVSTKSLLASKTLVAFVWAIINNLVLFGSMFIINYTKNSGNKFKESIDSLKEAIVASNAGVTLGQYITAMIFYILSVILLVYLLNYTGMAFGQSVTKAHRVAGAIGSIVGLIILFFIFTMIIMKIIASAMPGNFYTLMSPFSHETLTTFITYIIYNVVISALFFFITDHILKKKLDLE